MGLMHRFSWGSTGRGILHHMGDSSTSWHFWATPECAGHNLRSIRAFRSCWIAYLMIFDWTCAVQRPPNDPFNFFYFLKMTKNMPPCINWALKRKQTFHCIAATIYFAHQLPKSIFNRTFGLQCKKRKEKKRQKLNITQIQVYIPTLTLHICYIKIPL